MIAREKIIGTSIIVAGIACHGHAFAFGGFFQNVIENAAKQAVQQGVEQGVGQAVGQAVNPSPAPMNQPVGVQVINGCYYNLPAAPAVIQGFNPDRNSDGCVSELEYAAYMNAVNTINASNAASNKPSQAAAPATSGIASALASQAINGHGRGLPINGTAAGWVAGQQALGAAVQSMHAQQAPQPSPAANANIVDANGDGIVTAEEIAAYQARAAAYAGAAVQQANPAAVPAASNAINDAVGGAVGGAVKGLLGW